MSTYRRMSVRATHRRLPLVALALAAALLALPVCGATAADKVVISETGTRVTVEAHNARLSEVLDRMKETLKLKFTYTDRVELDRVVEGRTSGSLREVMAWLVPNGGFMLHYDDEANATRATRISFMGASKGGGAARPATAARSGSTPGSAQSTPIVTSAPPPVTPVTPTAVEPTHSPEPTTAANQPTPAPAGGISNDAIVSVADQLRASTQAQMGNAAASGGSGGSGGASSGPAFMQSQGGGSQGTLQEQAARSQQLAIQQLQALMNAYKAACTGNPNGPC